MRVITNPICGACGHTHSVPALVSRSASVACPCRSKIPPDGTTADALPPAPAPSEKSTRLIAVMEPGRWYVPFALINLAHRHGINIDREALAAIARRRHLDSRGEADAPEYRRH